SALAARMAFVASLHEHQFSARLGFVVLDRRRHALAAARRPAGGRGRERDARAEGIFSNITNLCIRALGHGGAFVFKAPATRRWNCWVWPSQHWLSTWAQPARGARRATARPSAAPARA